MAGPKRVLCIMDLSGVGRSSMAVVLPTLSACGIQACALPTALLSAHTGGFGEVAVLQADAYVEQALLHYQQQNIHFDAVYVGYLQSEQQFDAAEKALRVFADALCIVDPAMADNGKLYSRITPQLAARMKTLCDLADVVTPNWTESAVLSGENMQEQKPDNAAVKNRIEAIAANKKSVLITSVPAQNGELQIAGYDAVKNDVFEILVKYVPQSYPGTGDLFAAALVGMLLHGSSLKKAAQTAAEYVEIAAQITYNGHGEARHGVWFEQALPFLVQAAQTGV